MSARDLPRRKNEHQQVSISERSTLAMLFTDPGQAVGPAASGGDHAVQVEALRSELRQAVKAIEAKEGSREARVLQEIQICYHANVGYEENEQLKLQILA